MSSRNFPNQKPGKGICCECYVTAIWIIGGESDDYKHFTTDSSTVKSNIILQLFYFLAKLVNPYIHTR
jgi:hypothetical protein